MKTLYFAIAVLVLNMTMGCRSVQKLVDKGQYDDAIFLATEKLSGAKKRKTKHVKALEDAFSKVSARDLDRIAFLKAKNDPALWEDIYSIGQSIKKRQNRISPFLPLISSDGYPAHFDFVDTDNILLESGQLASEYHYSQGIKLMFKANAGNKLAARDAHEEFNSIYRYNKSYKAIDSLLEVSHLLGITHVLVKINNNILDPLFFNDQPINSRYADRFWIHFHDDEYADTDYDLISQLHLDVLDISPEREEINRFVETKEKEKWIDKLDNKGKPVLDSLGNTIQIKKTETFRAQIKEIKRTKLASLIGHAEIRDYKNNDLLDDQQFTINIDFYSDAYNFKGDREALSSKTVKHIDKHLELFPTDLEMAYDAIDKIIISFEEFMRGINY